MGYNGKPVWNAPTDIFDLFEEEDQALAKAVLFKPYQLLDICRMSDDDISQRFWSGLFEFTLKHQRSKNFHAFLEKFFPWVNEISPQKWGSQYANILLKYTVTRIVSDDDRIYFLNMADQWLAPELRREVMTLAQEFEQHGVERGIEQAIMAYRLLADGMPVEKVANLTELSLATVEKIQADTEKQ